jgi:hypothetical protein
MFSDETRRTQHASQGSPPDGSALPEAVGVLRELQGSWRNASAVWRHLLHGNTMHVHCPVCTLRSPRTVSEQNIEISLFNHDRFTLTVPAMESETLHFWASRACSFYKVIHQWFHSPFLGPGLFFAVGRTLWTSDQPVARPLPTQTSTPRVGFEPTTPAFERGKTDHALHRAAAVVGSSYKYYLKIRSYLTESSPSFHCKDQFGNHTKPMNTLFGTK